MKTGLSMLQKLQKLQKQFLKNQNPQPLLDFFETDEYKNARYEERNFGFITSHKLKNFSNCQLEYKYKYLDLVIPDIDLEAQKRKEDYFIVGQAFDDMMTSPELFEEIYEVVSIRSKGAEKKQLTKGQNRILKNMVKEFLESKIFKKNPKKKIILKKYSHKTAFGVEDFILKAEFDDFDENWIYDLKTAANIITFDAPNYIFQGAFYSLLSDLAEGKERGFRLEVVDKNTSFARSAGFEIPHSELKLHFADILSQLEKLAEAHSTGLFEKTNDLKHLMNSPYYNYNEYGRQKEWQLFY